MSITKALAVAFLRLSGWTTVGQQPAARRFVLIAVPHTSNWDLAYLLAMARVYDIRVNWMGKHTLFRGPMGTIMRKLGGIPVRRDRATDMVSQMAEAIEKSDSIALVVPPEGTRSYTSHWKSGFYHIACRAGVPIVLSYLDWGRKVGGIGPELIPTGDVREDMEEIRSFYAGMTGRFPDQVGEIQLKEER